MTSSVVSRYDVTPNGDHDTLSTLRATFRVTPDEQKALVAASEALELNLSQLIELACVDQAHRLGLYDGISANVRVKAKEWKDAPARRHSEVSATERITSSFAPPNLLLVQKTADWLGVPPSAFLVGASFRYVARKKKEHPENKRLVRIVLPAQYDEE